MAIQTSIGRRNYLHNDNNENHINEYDEEIDETEDDLIANYYYLTKHELLHEEETYEWIELTKNICNVVRKALLPNGGHDALIHKNKPIRHHSRKKSFHDYDPVLSKKIEHDDDDKDKIHFEIDDEF